MFGAIVSGDLIGRLAREQLCWGGELGAWTLLWSHLCPNANFTASSFVDSLLRARLHSRHGATVGTGQRWSLLS